ncbi:TRAM1-domain-containing protein [Panus rudis PR-1116 ss-1]|nr:TRAM1-domain-containing protein [Panus rudis PR-1116 ss-1]
MRWVVVPSSLLKLLLIPLTFWANWELFVPYLAPNASNPFSPLLFISHRISDSSPQDPRYQKGWLDLLFIAYYIIFWSFVRQTITVHLLKPLGKWFGLTKEAKIDRFAEQGYAAMYFAVMASWGLRIMSQLPTWWYQTEHFWIDYPHWEMIPELKTYYLMQSAYWCQQFIVMVLGLEKPRKDYHILVAHHAVTLYLIGGSYLTNMTVIGNAVYLSMDLPDIFLAVRIETQSEEYDR